MGVGWCWERQGRKNHPGNKPRKKILILFKKLFDVIFNYTFLSCSKKTYRVTES